jgi:hypothetical protein
MSFNAAHNAVVLYALETGTITESPDGITPAILPPVPSSPVVLGYTNLPSVSRGLNNSKGFALGLQGAAYNKYGRQEPSMGVEIRPGNVAALSYLQPDPDTGILPWLCLYLVVKGRYTDVLRFCKPGAVSYNLGGGNGQGGEISVSTTFQGMAYQRIGALTVPTSAVRALGTPMMWHDVRQFSIGGVGYRRALMSLTASNDMGLERKNERPDWGPNNPLSRTCYDMLEHHKTVTGEISLHERLPEDLFTGAQDAQEWGDIAVNCSSTPAGRAKGFLLNLLGCFPGDETQPEGEASAEIDHTVPFSADDITFEIED